MTFIETVYLQLLQHVLIVILSWFGHTISARLKQISNQDIQLTTNEK